MNILERKSFYDLFNKIISIVNLATARKLGVDFDLETLTTQLKDRENIFFLLDPAHMLKLVRNAFKERYYYLYVHLLLLNNRLLKKPNLNSS